MNEKEIEGMLYGACIRLISKRPRSVHEIEVYLNNKLTRYSSLTTNYQLLTPHLINRLLQSDFLNDEVFVDWWVESRNYFRPKGKRALISELIAKGIDDGQITEYFEAHAFDEPTLAADVLRKKSRTLMLLDPKIRKQKAIELLLRRGFGYDSAKKALESSFVPADEAM